MNTQKTKKVFCQNDNLIDIMLMFQIKVNEDLSHKVSTEIITATYDITDNIRSMIVLNVKPAMMTSLEKI